MHSYVFEVIWFKVGMIDTIDFHLLILVKFTDFDSMSQGWEKTKHSVPIVSQSL